MSTCSICGREVCGHLHPPFGPIRIQTPLDLSPDEFVEWLHRNGFTGAHIDRETPLFHQELVELKPYPMPARPRIFDLEFEYPHFQEEPQLTPSVPYIPVKPEDDDEDPE